MRDYCVAENATLRATRPDPFGFAQGRLSPRKDSRSAVQS
jgi:hypothetical protein